MAVWHQGRCEVPPRCDLFLLRVAVSCWTLLCKGQPLHEVGVESSVEQQMLIGVMADLCQPRCGICRELDMLCAEEATESQSIRGSVSAEIGQRHGGGAAIARIVAAVCGCQNLGERPVSIAGEFFWDIGTTMSTAAAGPRSRGFDGLLLRHEILAMLWVREEASHSNRLALTELTETTSCCLAGLSPYQDLGV